MTPESSVTAWIAQVKLGDDDAAQKLWQRYHEPLLSLAANVLRSATRREADEEDVVQEAFDAFFRAARDGQLHEGTDRDDFWALISKITVNRAKDHRRRPLRQKRGQGKVRGESALDSPLEADARRGLEQIADARSRNDESIRALVEELCQMFDRLGETQVAEIVGLRAANWTLLEIAQQLDITVATVRRKLRLMAERLERELAK